MSEIHVIKVTLHAENDGAVRFRPPCGARGDHHRHRQRRLEAFLTV